MTGSEKIYIAIDLKSFYASVECVERGLDPLDTLLVVADKSRTAKTICLAVSPALKAYGTGGRPRLFEVEQCVRKANLARGHSGVSHSARLLAVDPSLAIDYLVAPPRMAYYIEYSTRIYNVYLRYVAPEDIHVYSIDEVFIDATSYVSLYNLSAHDLAMKMIREVLSETGVTATAGIGTNLYLAKIAMDIVAKKMAPDADGVRIASLDETSYRRTLWSHEPITDFWRVGKGIADRLSDMGLYTMGDVALQSHVNDAVLYREFGVNAELLIDHAWGWEPVTINEIKSYRPTARSISSGQVLTEPYTSAKARNVVLEMAEDAAFDLLDRGLSTCRITLTIGYDVENLAAERNRYDGPVTIDRYGRSVPRHSHGTINLETPSNLRSALIDAVAALFDRIVKPDILVRRLTLSFNDLTASAPMMAVAEPVQLDLFEDADSQLARLEQQRLQKKKEQKLMQAEVLIKKKFGKNALLSGLNFTDCATQRTRNHQIGGHHE